MKAELLPAIARDPAVPLGGTECTHGLDHVARVRVVTVLASIWVVMNDEDAAGTVLDQGHRARREGLEETEVLHFSLDCRWLPPKQLRDLFRTEPLTRERFDGIFFVARPRFVGARMRATRFDHLR